METSQTSGLMQKALESVEYLRNVIPIALAEPRIGVICGSGLGGLADAIDNELRVEVAYRDIPHFAPTTGCFAPETFDDEMTLD